ncbi:hypothetical protein FN846DRAFT_893538 [Sphaerosporella brunnea]|uniref:Alpha/Beta hydrolase protein n=1 Tax=Sphaerosporella brunnea TaxID=1250544 RepID=A0A5J5EM83_9PEZI|nr:hypothetical protein FN846DRAFT_893538 [Sphaerosporella brunnea]
MQQLFRPKFGDGGGAVISRREEYFTAADPRHRRLFLAGIRKIIQIIIIIIMASIITSSTSLRISGVPTTTSKKDLSKACGVRSDCISLAPTDSEKDSVLTATVTFDTKRAAEKFRTAKRLPRCLGRRPSIDGEFMGLTVLAASPQDEVEYGFPSLLLNSYSSGLVAVHGLNGHAFQTWTAGDRMWLRDFLPEQLPKARIMTYGYNSNVWDSSSTTTIPEFAQGLLGALVNKRGRKDRKRPIVFALTLALKEKSTTVISTATSGIVFLATPHRGSDTASNSVLGLAAKALGLFEIEKEFRITHGALELATFYETKKTKIARVISAFDHVIVDRSSALLNVGEGVRYPLERDHRNICKFAHIHEDDYKAVSNQVARMVKAAPAAVKARAIVKALHMPQISAMFRIGGTGGVAETLSAGFGARGRTPSGDSFTRGYSDAWTDDCTLRLR